MSDAIKHVGDTNFDHSRIMDMLIFGLQSELEWIG